MTNYKLIARMAEGVARLTSAAYGQQLWTVAKSRRPAECAHCCLTTEAGEQTWRPLTNGANRMHRICDECIGILDPVAPPQRMGGGV